MKLKKELGLLNVYAIATGATLSSGFFLLPGLAAAEAGPALPLSYLIAALLILPGIFSMAELATAMPRSGGVYYFIDRSLGPYFGTIGGLGTWIALVLKTSFALVGIGAYLSLYLPGVPFQPVAVSFAVLFAIVNYFGAKKSGGAQVVLVFGLLLLLLWFTGLGATRMTETNFHPFLPDGGASIMPTVGLVIVSYIGLTKIASVAEEVRNPERTIPLGMFLALITAVGVYVIGTSVMIGVASVDGLTDPEHILTPASTVADVLVGSWGGGLMAVAAILAFLSVGNAGILSASRYPLAMSRDRLIPSVFGKIGRYGTPTTAIVVTTGCIILFVTVLDPRKIAKLAGAFQLIMFAVSALAVIVMRESRIAAYDPSFKSPLYPGLHIFGIAVPFWMIADMGWLTILFTLSVVLLGSGWYRWFASRRVDRTGALFHVFSRVAEHHFSEQRGKVMDSESAGDSFDYAVLRGLAFDYDVSITFKSAVQRAAKALADRISVPATRISDEFLRSTGDGILKLIPGIAMSHIHMNHIVESEIVLIRCKNGLTPESGAEATDLENPPRPVTALILLVAPRKNPTHHLRMLARIAQRLTEPGFAHEWQEAPDAERLKNVLLNDSQFRTVRLTREDPSRDWINKQIDEIDLGLNALVVSLVRDGMRFTPKGGTLLREGDHMTIMGTWDTVVANGNNTSGE